MVELLVVIGVLAVIVALTMPAIQAARESGRRSQCMNNLRQIGLAAAGYQSVWGAWPAGCVENRGRQLSWNVFLLPYLEQEQVWKQFDTGQRYDSEANREAGGTVIPAFLCPSTALYANDRHGDTVGDRNGNGRWDPGDGLAFTDYGGMFGCGAPGQKFMNGVMVYDLAIRPAMVLDGLSNTIMVAEDSGRGVIFNGQWANGQNIYDQTGGINVQQNNEIWSEHPGGAQVLLCDSSVTFLKESISNQVLFALCTRAGREPVSIGDAE